MRVESCCQANRFTTRFEITADSLTVNVAIAAHRRHEKNFTVRSEYRTDIEMRCIGYLYWLTSVSANNPNGRWCKIADVIAYEELAISCGEGDKLFVGRPRLHHDSVAPCCTGYSMWAAAFRICNYKSRCL